MAGQGAGEQAFNCSGCGRPLKFIPQYGAYYCYYCQAYETPGMKAQNPCPTCSGEMNYIDVYNSWYCYTCQTYGTPTSLDTGAGVGLAAGAGGITEASVFVRPRDTLCPSCNRSMVGDHCPFCDAEKVIVEAEAKLKDLKGQGARVGRLEDELNRAKVLFGNEEYDRSYEAATGVKTELVSAEKNFKAARKTMEEVEDILDKLAQFEVNVTNADNQINLAQNFMNKGSYDKALEFLTQAKALAEMDAKKAGYQIKPKKARQVISHAIDACPECGNVMQGKPDKCPMCATPIKREEEGGGWEVVPLEGAVAPALGRAGPSEAPAPVAVAANGAALRKAAWESPPPSAKPPVPAPAPAAIMAPPPPSEPAPAPAPVPAPAPAPAPVPVPKPIPVPAPLPTTPAAPPIPSVPSAPSTPATPPPPRVLIKDGRCPVCHEEVEADWKRCPFCNSPLVEGAAPAAPAGPAPASAPSTTALPGAPAAVHRPAPPKPSAPEPPKRPACASCGSPVEPGWKRCPVCMKPMELAKPGPKPPLVELLSQPRPSPPVAAPPTPRPIATAPPPPKPGPAQPAPAPSATPFGKPPAPTPPTPTAPAAAAPTPETSEESTPELAKAEYDALEKRMAELEAKGIKVSHARNIARLAQSFIKGGDSIKAQRYIKKAEKALEEAAK